MSSPRDLEAQKRSRAAKDKSGNDGLLHPGLKHDGYFQKDSKSRIWREKQHG